MTTERAPLPYPDDVKQLLQMLTYKRAHNTESEREFIEKFIIPLNPTIFYDPMHQTLAYAVEVGTGSKTMFSCHTDTMHRTSGSQVIAYDEQCQLVYKSTNPEVSDTECLGADDGAGCWIMLQMIAAQVAGVYVFHRGEERGGIGSSGMAEHHSDFLARFERAVAFDRRDYGDVITHQGMGRCCSDQFAEALAAALNAVDGVGLQYNPCDGGIFTDTANYTHIVPECTNLSVGYSAEHTSGEALDVEHLRKLRDACLVIKWETLPVERDPADESDDWYSVPYGGWSEHAYKPYYPIDVEDVTTMSFKQLKSWVTRADPADVAEIILELADRIDQLETEAFDQQCAAYDTCESAPYPYEGE